jgi:hypothetical protein
MPKKSRHGKDAVSKVAWLSKPSYDLCSINFTVISQTRLIFNDLYASTFPIHQHKVLILIVRIQRYPTVAIRLAAMLQVIENGSEISFNVFITFYIQ